MERIKSLADSFSAQADQLDAEAEKAFQDKSPHYQSECVLKSGVFREAAFQCLQEIGRIKANIQPTGLGPVRRGF